MVESNLQKITQVMGASNVATAPPKAKRQVVVALLMIIIVLGLIHSMLRSDIAPVEKSLLSLDDAVPTAPSSNAKTPLRSSERLNPPKETIAASPQLTLPRGLSLSSASSVDPTAHRQVPTSDWWAQGGRASDAAFSPSAQTDILRLDLDTTDLQIPAHLLSPLVATPQPVYDGLIATNMEDRRNRARLSRVALANFSSIVDENGFEVGILVDSKSKGTQVPLYYPAFELGGRPLPPLNDHLDMRKKFVPHLPRHCPVDRFLMTWGFWGHHNRMQMLLNVIAYGHRFNRTVVTTWTNDLHTVYDFSEIKKRYCAISEEEAKPFLSLGNMSFEFAAEPNRSCDLLSRPNFVPSTWIRIPGYHGSEKAYKDMMKNHVVPLFNSSANVVCLLGSTAFGMRLGIWEAALIFRHIQPTHAVLLGIQQALRSSMAIDIPEVSDIGKALLPYMAFHSRSRDGMCDQESRIIHHTSEGFLDDLNDPIHYTPSAAPLTGWQVLRIQCGLTLPFVDLVWNLTKPVPGTRLLLVSDKQNATFDRLMVSEMKAVHMNASYMVVDGKTPDTISELAVDFFLMTLGRHFSGHSVSSVSQNACYIRLSRGLSCDGWIPHLMLFPELSVLGKPLCRNCAGGHQI